MTRTGAEGCRLKTGSAGCYLVNPASCQTTMRANGNLPSNCPDDKKSIAFTSTTGFRQSKTLGFAVLQPKPNTWWELIPARPCSTPSAGWWFVSSLPRSSDTRPVRPDPCTTHCRKPVRNGMSEGRELNRVRCGQRSRCRSRSVADRPERPAGRQQPGASFPHTASPA